MTFSALSFRPLSSALLFALVAGGASAATFTVTTNLDSGAGSLRQAIADAKLNAEADTITFDGSLAGATIALTSNDADGQFGPTALVISDELTLDGGGAPGLALSGGDARRILAVTSAGHLTLQRITLSNGRAKGGNGGGAISSSGGGALGAGGAIFVGGGSLDLIQCTLATNTALGGDGGLDAGGSWGGSGGGGMGGDGATVAAGAAGGPPNGGSARNAGGPGGGGGGAGSAYASGGAGGFGGGGGGGYYHSGGAGGFGGGGGGGYFGAGGGSGFGAGVGASSGAFARGGGGAGLGGAVFSNGGTVTITNSTLAGNTATGGTGFVAGNGMGGAVFNRSGALTLLNCTISGNTAAQGGRQVFNLGDGATAAATISNTILGQADTTTTDFVSATILGGAEVVSGVANLIRGFGGTLGTMPMPVMTDPKLSALADNTGCTKTMLPAGDSPVLDAGDAAAAATLTVDQRGAARFHGGLVSIGSLQTSSATVVSLNSLRAAPVAGGVRITWTTGSELDATGFHLWRAAMADGAYARLNTGLIPATGVSPSGASYSWTDTAVSAGQTWFYKLEDLDTSGVGTLHGPVSAHLGASPVLSFTATPPSIFTGGGSTLHWTVTGNPALSIDGLGSVTGGSVRVAPALTTSYTLTDGQGAQSLVTVTVRPYALKDTAGLARAWGSTRGETGYDPCYDLNGDGRVDDSDVEACFNGL